MLLTYNTIPVFVCKHSLRIYCLKNNLFIFQILQNVWNNKNLIFLQISYMLYKKMLYLPYVISVLETFQKNYVFKNPLFLVSLNIRVNLPIIKCI